MSKDFLGINNSSITRVNIFTEIPAIFVYFLTRKYISWLFIQSLVSIPFIFVSIHFPKCKLEPQAKSAWIFLKLECYVSFLLLIPKMALLKEFKVSFILFSLSKKNCSWAEKNFGDIFLHTLYKKHGDVKKIDTGKTLAFWKCRGKTFWRIWRFINV